MEMLQAMKQKPTPAAVVVKSSPQDSPSGPAAGKPLHSPPCPSTPPPCPSSPVPDWAPLCQRRSSSAPRATAAAGPR